MLHAGTITERFQHRVGCDLHSVREVTRTDSTGLGNKKQLNSDQQQTMHHYKRFEHFINYIKGLLVHMDTQRSIFDKGGKINLQVHKLHNRFPRNTHSQVFYLRDEHAAR